MAPRLIATVMNVCRVVELAGPDGRGPQRAVPVLRDEPLFVDRAARLGREDERLAVGVERLRRAKDCDLAVEECEGPRALLRLRSA